MKTLGYPNYEYYMPISPQRNTTKWVQAVREMYYKIHKGTPQTQAFADITKEMDKMEKLDFTHWLKFYEEDTQHKYKQAQVSYWDDPNRMGYFLPMRQERKVEMPQQQQQVDLNTIKDISTHPDMIQEEKRRIIEKQRAKIIGRLDSAEKLLRSHEGHMFAGNEYEQLVDILYQLKKKIQLVNKISVSIKLYQDMIIREANVLTGKGYKEASGFLVKIAQEIPSAAEPINPALIGDAQTGTLPGQAPGQVAQNNFPPADISVDLSQNGAPPGVIPTDKPIPQEEPMSEGLKDFLDGLDTANKTTIDELEVDENVASDFVSEAQMAPEPVEPPAEVSEDLAEPEVKGGRDFDKELDQTFANITVADVVNKLEDVAKIFKNREISRQLSLVDLMLDRLGLASFFPELSESIGKANESTMYMGSRVESVLAKLRGTLETKKLDLTNETAPPPSPVAGQLQNMDEKEKAKKKMRKEIEDKALEDANKPKPEVDMKTDLAEPAALQPGPAEAPLPPPAPPVR